MRSTCETPAPTTASTADRLEPEFFCRDVVEVARDCLGMELEAYTRTGCARGRIVEVEAYRGPDDRAAHSHGGRRTPRTEAMFGPPGHAYVFLIYGIHTHLNIVTGPIGQPQAVLIRALEPVSGIELMHERRAGSTKSASNLRRLAPYDLCSGPGKLCQALDITRRFNARDLLSLPAESGAEYVLLRPGIAPNRIASSARIGIDYAGEWASKPWRFYDLDSPYVSRTPKRTSIPHV